MRYAQDEFINWQGQRFVYLGFEGEPGQTVEQQSRGLFERADAELKALGLALDKNVVRNRVFGRTREARDVVSAVRGKSFPGQSRAATSSFITTMHFNSAADVALDLYAMAAPAGGAPRQVTRAHAGAAFHQASHLGADGVPCRHDLRRPSDACSSSTRTSCRAPPRSSRKTGCDWKNVVRIAFCLHKDEDPQALAGRRRRAGAGRSRQR